MAHQVVIDLFQRDLSKLFYSTLILKINALAALSILDTCHARMRSLCLKSKACCNNKSWATLVMNQQRSGIFFWTNSI